MLPDFTVIASTSDKCPSSEIMLPDIGSPLDIKLSPSSLKHPMTPKPPPNRGTCPSMCKVCRHPATGYHYDVPSCNGCKTFFRRSILDGRKYSCLKMRKCMMGEEPVDLTRRMCRACRFEKCVDAGMNPAAIQADVKNSEGEELKNEIIAKRQTGDGVNPKQFLGSFNDTVEKIIEQLTMIEMKIEPLYVGGLPAGFMDNRRVEEILSAPVTLSVDNFLIPSSPNPNCVNPITGEIRKGSGCYIHTCILASLEYSKMFEFGSKIDFESKLLLMKHAAYMCTDIMSSFYSYSAMKSERLVHPDGKEIGPPKVKYGEPGVAHTITKQKTLISLLRNEMNKVEYLLLKAIVLCNPAVCGLPPLVQQTIGQERQLYVRSLLTYCLLNYGSVHGPARFSALLSIPMVLEFQQKSERDFHHLAKATILKGCWADIKRISPLYEQIMES